MKLITYLKEEKDTKRKGGLYHKTQINLTCNSNRIEGSKLTEEQTRYIFETRTIGFKDQEAVPVDDIIEITFENIVEYHYRFEKIHPFQDGNGRVGHLIMFRECLKNNIIPFIIDDNYKQFYYRGLKEFANARGYLTDTCLSAQDTYKEWIKYF